jgi:hypothetical protein
MFNAGKIEDIPPAKVTNHLCVMFEHDDKCWMEDPNVELLHNRAIEDARAVGLGKFRVMYTKLKQWLSKMLSISTKKQPPQLREQ